jgi:hypothetical protein
VAPPSLAGSRTASFEFTASKAGTQFQCRLDGGDFSPCTSPQQFGELPEGTHTFEVRAFDSKGNVDGTPAIYTWTIDVTAPAPRIASASGSAPSVQGSAGTASGDDGSVRVDLFSGSAASGSPVQTVVASRDGSGSFGAQFDRVAGGTYTVSARQSDAAGNSGSSSPVTFAVPGQASAPPPDFAVLSTEESMVDASAGRLTALSSCEGDCRRSSSLLVSSRTAGRLGLPRRGSRAVRLGGGATRVKLTRAARTALRRSDDAVTATLRAVAGSVSLSKAISLRPSIKPSRLASRGLKLAGECSAACTMSARLIVSSTTARRLGIRTKGGSVAIGSGRIDAAAGRTASFTVRLVRSAHTALSRARSADLTLEVVVNGAGTASRRATRRITLGG